MLSLPGTKNVFRERFSLLCQNGFQEKWYLHTYLPAGHYTLRACAYWMQNFDDAFGIKGTEKNGTTVIVSLVGSVHFYNA